MSAKPPRVEPPAYPEIVRGEEERDRFARLYDDLIRVIGLAPEDALLRATEQYQLGFDVRGAFEKRKRRKRVAFGTEPEGAAVPDREPPG